MRSIRQLLSAVLAAVLFAAAVLLAAAPASAHDAAESSSPAQGATVAAPPEKVSITFNRDPLALGSQIRVSDAGGTNWAEGPVEIVDNVASQKLKPGAPAGQFTVVWRVVSSDSHPIEGSFTFTATTGAAGTSGAGQVPAPGQVPTAGTAQPGITPAPETVPDASQPFPWSLVIFGATALGILVALGVMARRSLKPASEESGSEESGSDPEE
jgi:methionine-rich copper-binding protein CopC